MRVVSKSSSLMDIMAEVSEMSVASWCSKRPTEQVHLLAKLKSESARKRQQVVSNERSLHQIVACLKPLGVSEPSSWSALISRIAGCGPACPVVWEGASARGLPIPIASCSFREVDNPKPDGNILVVGRPALAHISDD